VGSELVVDGTPRTVVGVVSTGSAYPLRSSLWIPLVPDAMSPERLQRGMLTLVARTGEGLSLEAVQAELDRLAQVLRDELPERNRNLGFRVEALRETLVSDARPAMLGLMVGVGLLLAIACANVANLLLVRVDRERWEIAVRMSLGASTRDVVVRSLSESLGLALIAGAVGVAMAYAALGPLVAMVPDDTFGLEDVRISGSVLLFSSLMSILTVLVFGVVPAIVASGAAPGNALRSASGGSGVGSKFQSRFVVVQAGVGVVLLVSAGLVFQSVARLQRVDPGFEAGDHLTFRLMAPEVRYPGHPARLAFFRRVLEEVRTIPGVDRAAGAHVLPIGDVAWGYAHSVEDLPPFNPGDQNMSFLRVVTSEYFATMGTPLIDGRDFDKRDNLESLPVAIVSRRAAEAYWPDQKAVGKRIKRGAYDGENPWVTVIGVVENVRDGGLAEDPALTVYLPYAQQDNSYTTFMSMVMRAQAGVGIAEVSARVRRVDPTAALFRIRTLEDVVTASLSTKRFSAVLLTLFGIMGAPLTALGVYGVTEHAASQRRREMAIRLALGAGGVRVGGLLLRRALGLATLGTVLGLAALGLLTLTSLTELIGIEQLDGTVLVGAALAVCAVAVLSCLRPSWKAATLEPAVVLRGD
jgi:predicted permease